MEPPPDEVVMARAAGSDREQVEAAMTDYLEAFADGDGEEACRHVAEPAA